jgi:regulation of enolase protein 1 (concanavalin A-like superfamily)
MEAHGGAIRGMIRSFLAAAGLISLAAVLRAGEPDNAEAISKETPKEQAGSVAPVTDDFRGKLGEGWRWLRENREGWRETDNGLQVLVEPGNMWGGANDAKNVLLRGVPEAMAAAADVSVEISHKPQNRWEQANLVWYYSDSHMVKLGLEIENGRTNIVMGREEGDKTKTIAIIPYEGETVELRFTVRGQDLQGWYRRPGAADWTVAGKTTVPVSPVAPAPHISLQFYQGVAGSGRWATVRKFRLAVLK